MPARLSSASSSLKPSGSIKWSVVLVAAHNRATFPVFGGISGSTRTMCMAGSDFGPRSSGSRLIEHFAEHQAVRRRGHSRHLAIFFGEHPFDFVRRKLSQANLHECPNDPAAHLVEEAVALDDERQQRAATLYLDSRQSADGGLSFVAGSGGKGAEIVLAYKQSRRDSHRAQVERTRHVPGREPNQRIHRRMAPNEVPILLARRVEARVEIGPRARRKPPERPRAARH